MAGPDPALLARLIDRVPAMLAYWDSDQRCRFANRGYERWFARSPESMIGMHASELLGAIYPLNLPYIEGALGGVPQQFEREIPDPAGGPPRECLASYLPDVADGTVRGFFVIVSDVTDIKRAQSVVAESEERFSSIVAMSSDAIITVDETQRITLFNQGAQAIFGYAPAEILGQPLETLLPERFRHVHRGHVSAFRDGPPRSRPMGGRIGAVIGLRKNGQEFPAEAAISRIDLHGLHGHGTTLLTVALRDITERKIQEAEARLLADAGVVLAASLDYEQTLRAIAQLVTEHGLGELCVVDTLRPERGLERLAISHSDPAMADTCARLAALSLESNQLLSSSVLETRAPRVFEITDELVASYAQHPEHRQILRELAVRSSMVVPLATPTRLLGVLVISSRTPARYGDRELRVATQLADRAALAIENAHLYAAAQRATQARDDVLGIVAHDVRSPLNAIALATTLLERQVDEWDDPRALQALEMIRTSVTRANRLIADLLDVRRIEGGALSIERALVPVEPIVADAVRAHQLAARAASLDLVHEIVGAPAVCVDRDRILQVLENLVGNAIKFSPAGGRIVVEVAKASDEVVFAVRDTGVGIAAQNVPHVFDRFWQAGRARRDSAGLGLAICKGIVEAHGGRIWVETEPGQGSTFRFSIPSGDDPDSPRVDGAVTG